ncbi:MAG: two-component system chemotaxis sensor kinase CheA [Candidatus Paceibacteria bacterium]|jgi:two-component system chemotaxis sensor kinase CheA
MSDMQDAINEFLIESHENLDRLDNDLLKLEEHPKDEDILGSIFRTIHTIKGTCGFLGYSHLESVAHVGENLLGKLREGTMDLSEAITDSLLHLVDAVREMLAVIESDGNDGDKDYAELIAVMDKLLQGPGASEQNKATESESSEEQVAAVIAADGFDEDHDEDEDEMASAEVTPTVTKGSQAQSASISASSGSADGESGPAKSSDVASSKIRVDVSQLDLIMNLVGELVLARNQILQFGSQEEDTAFQASTQRLNMITTELQEGVMKTRMQAIGTIWSKYPRITRDLAKACGKEIRLEMEGKDTELDKTILEAVKDPLTHIVRNSVDHGIEGPDEREAAGKPREGVLKLRAFHEGGQVNIEIIDDGAGISVNKLKAKAMQKGILSAEQVRSISDRDAINMIFAPGFSTAAKVTNVSGRGVGMDVVRTNIENIGGSVDISSVEGVGTTLRIKIPLTLAIIPALTINNGGQRFAIPQVNLLELVRLEQEDGESRVEFIHGTPVYRLRGTLLPLVYLNETLGMPKTEKGPDDDQAINIVVLSAEGHPFGLIVDSISDTEEIVVKPLDKQLKELDVYAGATIMGDGCVALILDATGLARHGNISTGNDRLDRGAGDFQNDELSDDSQAMLLFTLGETTRMSIPLSTVARLEEIRQEDIEMASGKPVVQYRGEIMPIVDLGEFFGVSEVKKSEVLQVIVYQHEGRSVGFAVDKIEDIIDEKIEIKNNNTSPGVAGSAVLAGLITELLDAPGVIHMAVPEITQSTFATTAAA